MNKKMKIVFAVLVVFIVVTIIISRNTNNDLEKTVIVNKIKATYTKIIPIKKHSDYSSIKKDNNHVAGNNDNTSYNNIVETVVFQEVFDEVSEKDILKLNSSYLDFIKKYHDATFFKADFFPLFERKVGDQVSFILDGIEYNGTISMNEKSHTDFEKYPSVDYYNININQFPNDTSFGISVSGFKDTTGKFKYSGTISYKGFEEKRFDIDNNIGVLVSDSKFDTYLTVDKGVRFY